MISRIRSFFNRTPSTPSAQIDSALAMFTTAEVALVSAMDQINDTRMSNSQRVEDKRKELVALETRVHEENNALTQQFQRAERASDKIREILGDD